MTYINFGETKSGRFKIAEYNENEQLIAMYIADLRNQRYEMFPEELILKKCEDAFRYKEIPKHNVKTMR